MRQCERAVKGRIEEDGKQHDGIQKLKMKRQHKYINGRKTFIRLDGIQHVHLKYTYEIPRWSRNIYTTKSLVFVEGQNAWNNMNDDTVLVSEPTVMVMATAPQNKKKITEPTLPLLPPLPPSPPHQITQKAYQHCVTSNAWSPHICSVAVVVLLLHIFPS